MPERPLDPVEAEAQIISEGWTTVPVAGDPREFYRDLAREIITKYEGHRSAKVYALYTACCGFLRLGDDWPQGSMHSAQPHEHAPVLRLIAWWPRVIPDNQGAARAPQGGGGDA